MRLSSLVWTGLLAVAPVTAHAACPIELATYSNAGDAAEIEFMAAGPSATVTNSFRMLLGELVLDGIVQWSGGIERPYGMLRHECPTGDVTGAEIEACTVWQGVIYVSDAGGRIGLLPAEGEPAPDRLLFPDLAQSLAESLEKPGIRFEAAGFDVFALKGCKE